MSQKATPRPAPFPALQVAAWTVLAFTGCEEQIAGTSVGTGNPTEIEVGFQDSLGEPVAVKGSLQVYASTQIPVPGFSPNPLFSVDVPGATSATLNAESFQGLADTLWPPGSVENGSYGFNVIVSGQTQGAILKGFAYRKRGSSFILPDGDVDAAMREGRALIQGAVSPVADIVCSIDTAELSSNKDHYLFLYGTGYAAKGVFGSFVFHAVPRISQKALFISMPRKDEPSSVSGDSLPVYSVSGEISPDSPNHLQRGGIASIVPIPESLKPK